MVDIFEYFKKHPRYNKYIGSDFVLVEYKCPLNVEEFQLWTKSHLITFVISGKKDWFTPNGSYNLKSGDAIFIKKGVYTTKQYIEEDYCVMLFFMNDKFIRDFIRENELCYTEAQVEPSSDGVVKIDTDNSFNTLVESIFQYLTMNRSIPQKLIELKFKELIFNIALNKKNHGFKNLLLEISNSGKSNIKQVMNSNFQYDLPIRGFAKLSGRSLSSFKRDFKEYFGTTPSKWLMIKRLEYSKMLLDRSQMNINEVCYECGFKNTSHYIKSFKSKYKLTPNQYRAIN
ncbi:MAG: AraC family transcriptional regulator [Maribacter sp.]|nr:AraC family transcriptional regulator [Maribacter sp.]